MLKNASKSFGENCVPKPQCLFLGHYINSFGATTLTGRWGGNHASSSAPRRRGRTRRWTCSGPQTGRPRGAARLAGRTPAGMGSTNCLPGSSVPTQRLDCRNERKNMGPFCSQKPNRPNKLVAARSESNLGHGCDEKAISALASCTSQLTKCKKNIFKIIIIPSCAAHTAPVGGSPKERFAWTPILHFWGVIFGVAFHLGEGANHLLFQIIILQMHIIWRREDVICGLGILNDEFFLSDPD